MWRGPSSAAAPLSPLSPPPHGAELDDSLSELVHPHPAAAAADDRDDGTRWFTICGFGSLLSERSARTTVPQLRNFRKARLATQKSAGFSYRRVFAHTADVFFERGIADPATREVASLSIERVEDADDGGGCGEDDSDNANAHDAGREAMVVSAFEAPYDQETVARFVAREHEFRFVALHLDDGSVAVACERWSDDEYVAKRFGGDRAAFERRWGVVWRGHGHGNGTVWHDPSVLPCRLYFRHCVLAARALGSEDNFLRTTFLADRRTTAGEWLRRLEEESGGEFLRSGWGCKGVSAEDPALLERYGG